MKPWFLNRPDAFRPGPPPALSSARYARDLEEVHRLGAVHSQERQPAQTSSVMLWQSMNMSPAFRQVSALAGRTHRAAVGADEYRARHNPVLTIAPGLDDDRPRGLKRRDHGAGKPAFSARAGPALPERPCGVSACGLWAEANR